MNGPKEFADRVCDRIRLHWTSSVCEGNVDADETIVVRVAVVDKLWLELRSPPSPADGSTPPWTVGPVEVDAAKMRRAVSRIYGVGLRADASAEDVADRLYEEVRFWWSEYERIAISTR